MSVKLYPKANEASRISSSWPPEQVLDKVTAKSKASNNYRYSKVLQILLALGGWTVLLILVSWIFVAVGWYLLALLWHREIMISPAAISTVRALMLILLLALIIFIVQLFWAKFNYTHYYVQNRRKLKPLVKNAPMPEWAEITVTPPCSSIDVSAEIPPAYRKSRRKLSPILSRTSPVKLLSTAATLSLNGDFIGAMSALRLVIEDVRTPYLLRRVAACRLAYLINTFGNDRLASMLNSHFDLIEGSKKYES